MALMYMNQETGEILTQEAMLEEWAEMYDGDDPTNLLLWDEIYLEMECVDIPVYEEVLA